VRLTFLFQIIQFLSYTLDKKMYIFVDYGGGVKEYILWDTTTHRITINRDVVFYESPLIKSNVVEVEMKQE
jgi:hypothetical protein